jgi:hypothetical protein
MYLEEWLLAAIAVVGAPLCWWLQTASGKDFELRLIERLGIVVKRRDSARDDLVWAKHSITEDKV